MPNPMKVELVSVSFHYFLKQKKVGKERQPIPFEAADFQYLCNRIEKYRNPDIKNDSELDAIRYGNSVILEDTQVIDSRTIFGRFRNGYWGHSFFNTSKGDIPVNSVNLRPFYYLLYFSDSGRIYLACQYLGQYGGYIPLKTTIRQMTKSPSMIEEHSLRVDALNVNKANVKEIRVSISKKSKDIAKPNRLIDVGMYAIRTSGWDSASEERARKSFFGILGDKSDKKKKEIAKFFSSGELLDINDEDIDDCSIVVRQNGKDRVIYLFDQLQKATKFPIDVQINSDGHPVKTQTKEAMLKLLDDQVLSKQADV